MCMRSGTITVEDPKCIYTPALERYGCLQCIVITLYRIPMAQGALSILGVNILMCMWGLHGVQVLRWPHTACPIIWTRSTKQGHALT